MRRVIDTDSYITLSGQGVHQLKEDMGLACTALGGKEAYRSVHGKIISSENK